MTLSELKIRLAARARELGAGAFGVSPAIKDPHTEMRLAQAVERGDLATWKYDGDWVRSASDPGGHLPHAQSVLCVAVAYAHPPPRTRLGTGQVSSYAWSGGDYHAILRELLEALVQELQAYGETAQTVVICDTKPLAERAVAAAAGLGWVGKHTNLIVPGFGSYVFLGEIVTTLAIPPDAPRKTHCGGCRRCVAVCPTGALRGDYTMDARRCISDLTQRRGSVPREMRPLMGTWVWGCDICQAACPPTIRAGYRGAAGFAPPADAHPDLLRLLVIGEREFDERYRASSMGWRGASILRRNAALALGNTLDRATVKPLLAAFDAEPSPVVREHIAWALGRIASPAAVAGANARLQREHDAKVCLELQFATAVATK